MKIGLWEFIKKPESMPYVINILIALLVAILGFLKVISVEVLIAAVLLVLSSIVSLLIILHSSISEFQKDLKTPGIKKNFKPFHEMRNDIRYSISKTDEI